MRKFTGLNGNGGSVKRLSPSPQAVGHPGTLSNLVPAGCGHWAKPSPPILSSRLPTLTAGTDAVGVGAASLARRFVQPTIPTRACCCRRLRARRPSSAPQHNVGTAIGAAQMECGGEGRAEGRGGLVLFPSLEAAPRGDQGQNLCVSVCPPHSLARLSPLRCTPDTSSHRLACFKVGSTSFWSNSPPGSRSLWSPAPGLLTLSAVLGFS